MLEITPAVPTKCGKARYVKHSMCVLPANRNDIVRYDVTSYPAIFWIRASDIWVGDTNRC